MLTYMTTTETKLDKLLSRGALPFPVQMAVYFAHLYVTWAERRNTRRHLAQLTPELLDDVGLSARQAHLEATKPFWKP